MKFAALVLALAGLAGCAHMPRSPGPAVLDSLLGFDEPAMCRGSAAHERLLNGMVRGDANEGFRAGRVIAPPDLATAFGRVEVQRHDGWSTLSVPVRGTLFSMPLIRIDQDFPEGGDPGGTSYAFAAPVERVEQVLRARGFPARVGKDVQMGPPDGYAYTMSLLPDPKNPRHSLWGCGYS